MYILISIILTVMMVLVLLFMALSSRTKGAIVTTLASFMAVIVLFFWIGKKTCGPSSNDVRVMMPQAKAIVGHIVKHGIPKSLANIPQLPHKLDRCVRKIKHKKKANTIIIVKSKKKADFSIIEEKCNFDGGYDASIFFRVDYGGNDTFGSLTLFSKTSRTGIEYSFITNSSGSIKVDTSKSPYVYNSKTSGICNPMKQ